MNLGFRDERLAQLGTAVRLVSVMKSAIGWELEDLEAAAVEEDSDRVSDSDDE